MSCQFLRSIGRILFAALLAAGVASLVDASAFAQGPMHGSLPNGPEDLWQGSTQNAMRKAHPIVNPQYNEPDLFQPFVDPLSFDSDFQLFAPTDLSNYGGPPPVNTGWYISYGR